MELNNSIKVLDDFQTKIQYNDKEISLTAQMDLLLIKILDKNSIYIYENCFIINSLKKMKIFSSIKSINEVINSILELLNQKLIHLKQTDNSINILIKSTMEKLILNKKLSSIESIVKYLIGKIEILENNLLKSQNLITEFLTNNYISKDYFQIIINNYDQSINDLKDSVFNNEIFMKNLEKKIKKQDTEKENIEKVTNQNLNHIRNYKQNNLSIPNLTKNNSFNIDNNFIYPIKKYENYNPLKKNININTNNSRIDDIYCKINRPKTPLNNKVKNDQLLNTSRNHKSNINAQKTKLSINNKEKKNCMTISNNHENNKKN